MVLFRDGSTHPLPGLEQDPLLLEGSPVVDLAHDALLSGLLYRSFVWPRHDGSQAAGHARITVLAAADVPPFVLGSVLMTAKADSGGLTARELEVLGLMVDGRSNQQIAEGLVVTPRTVATHVEHVLHKLEVPTRTMAAVRAEREGCYVPALRSSGSARPGTEGRTAQALR